MFSQINNEKGNLSTFEKSTNSSNIEWQKFALSKLCIGRYKITITYFYYLWYNDAT